MRRKDSVAHLRGRRRRITVLAILIVLSASSYAILATLGDTKASVPRATWTERLLLTAVLVLVSLLGVAAAIRPSLCVGLFHSKGILRAREGSPGTSLCLNPPPVVAHHCSCGRFSDHVLRLLGRDWCAGCTGMVLGAITGISLLLAMGIGPFPWTSDLTVLVTLAGATLSTAGISISSRTHRSPPMHVLANTALVLGLVGVTLSLSTLGAVPGLLGLAVALSVIGLRMEMSRLLHLSVFLQCLSEARGRVPSEAGTSLSRTTPR